MAVDVINANSASQNIAFVAVLGDLTDSAEMSELYKTRDILNELCVPWIPVIGNHDVWPHSGTSEAPEVGANSAGTDFYFNEVFRSQYGLLSAIFGNWEKESVPVWNPEVDPAHYGYFQNFAFDFNGYHFIGLDFNSRARSVGYGVWPEPDLYDYPGGTWYWFTNHLSQYVASHPESSENVILFAHHPMLDGGIFGFDMFSTGEITNTMYPFLLAYGANLLAEYCGHKHRNLTTPLGFMDVIETAANKDGPLVRLVRISPDGSVENSFLRPTPTPTPAPTATPAPAAASAQLQWLGQSSFILTSSKGTKVPVDPPSASTGYTIAPIAGVDVVLVTHEHSTTTMPHWLRAAPSCCGGSPPPAGMT
jgi:hypothetical protein